MSATKIFRLGDIAKIYRDYADTPDSKNFFNGEPAVEVLVSMVNGGDILKLGNNLDEKISEIQSELPLVMEIHKVSDQPTVVNNSIIEFLKTLVLAIVIVLAANFVAIAKSEEMRDEITKKFRTEFENNFPNVRINISVINLIERNDVNSYE